MDKKIRNNKKIKCICGHPKTGHLQNSKGFRSKCTYNCGCLSFIIEKKEIDVK